MKLWYVQIYAFGYEGVVRAESREAVLAMFSDRMVIKGKSVDPDRGLGTVDMFELSVDGPAEEITDVC